MLYIGKDQKLSIGRRIREVREYRGFSQDALSMLIGAYPTSMSNIEVHGQVSLGMLMRVCDVLRVSLDFVTADVGMRETYYSHKPQ